MGPIKRRRSNESGEGGSVPSPSKKHRPARRNSTGSTSSAFGRYYSCRYSDQDEMERTLFITGKPSGCSTEKFIIKLIAIARLNHLVPAKSIPILSCCELAPNSEKVAVEVDSVESAFLLLQLDGESIDGGPPLTVVRHGKAVAEEPTPTTFTLFVCGPDISNNDKDSLCPFLEKHARKVGLIDDEGSPFLGVTFHKNYAFVKLRSQREMKNVLHLNDITYNRQRLRIEESRAKTKRGESRTNNLKWGDFLREWRAEKEQTTNELQSQSVAPSSNSNASESKMDSTLSGSHVRGIPTSVEAPVVSDHEEDIQQLKEEIQRLLDRIHLKDEDLKKGQKECSGLREEIRNLESKNRDQSEELRQRQAEADDWHDKYNRLNDNFRRGDEDLQDARSRISDLREEIRRLEKDNARDRKDLMKETEAANEYQMKYENLKKEARSDVSNLEDQVRGLKRDYEGVRNDLEQYKRKYESLKSSQGTKKPSVADNNQELLSLREENVRLEKLKLDEVAKERKKADKFQKLYHDAISDCLVQDKEYKKVMVDLVDSKDKLHQVEDELDIEKEKRMEAEARVKRLEEALREHH